MLKIMLNFLRNIVKNIKSKRFTNDLLPDMGFVNAGFKVNIIHIQS